MINTDPATHDITFQLWAPRAGQRPWVAAWTHDDLTVYGRSDSPSLALSEALRACPDVDAAVAAGTRLLTAAQKHVAGGTR